MALSKNTVEATQDPNDLGLKNLDAKTLLRMRAEIDAVLGIGDLKDIDIGHEIAIQLRTAKLLQSEAMDDGDAGPGQKAQTAMAVQRLLQDLTKMRIELHSSERFKRIEEAIIEALKDQPVEVKDTFFEEYERILATFDTGLKLYQSE